MIPKNWLMLAAFASAMASETATGQNGVGAPSTAVAAGSSLTARATSRASFLAIVPRTSIERAISWSVF